MAINNLNPRRVVWFSPHEPSNKYDIWLSKNAHYDENGEPTTDSNAQRDCDYIFKIYDCGKWNPIVGFNTTAKYKINVVDGVEYTYTIPNTSTLHTNNGFQQNHLPLFRNPEDSPDELFDAGTLGEAIYGFVNEAEWNSIFQADWFINAFNTSIIGDNGHYNWNTLINSNIDFATTTQCGGILSDIHPNSSTARRAGILVMFTSADRNIYDHEYGRIPSNNLAITGDLIINAINDWYEENPSQPGINVNINNIIQQIIDTFDDEYPLLFGGNGILIDQVPTHSQITWKLQGLETASAGLFPRSTINSQNNRGIEWVTPSLTELSDVNIEDLTDGQVLLYNSTTQKWENNNISGLDIEYNRIDLDEDHFWINGDYITDENGTIKEMQEWNYYFIRGKEGFEFDGFSNIENHLNPIYIRFEVAGPTPLFSINSSGNVIDPEGCVDSNGYIGDGATVLNRLNYLFTLQFSNLKIEKIQYITTTANV